MNKRPTLRLLLTTVCLCLLLSNTGQCDSDSPNDYDVVIYGGTSAAVSAAVQAKKMGRSVIIVSPDKHLGGLTSGGLGWTDTGNKSVIGGLAKEFYHRVYTHYRKDDAWKWQQRDDYGNRAQGQRASDDDLLTMWVFEPRVAESILDGWIEEHDIPVIRDAWLDRDQGVEKAGNQIVSITTLDGKRYAGRMFLDATYEGDLIDAAGVETTFGREGIEDYDEPHAGVQTGVLHHHHHFNVLSKPVDPYVIPGDPKSGVIPLVSPEPPGEFGSADHRIQAYCFRVCMTDHPDNRVEWPKPKGYDPDMYEVLVRCFDAGWKNVFRKFDPLPNRKTDTNNHGPVSFDNIGMNYDYPNASYERRREIIAQHESYQKGILYFIANDPRVPPEIQTEMQRWGLAADEFTDNGNWPHQLYVRESRRMVGEFVITENHLRKQLPTEHSIGMGSYTIDSHNVQRYIQPDGTLQNEGDIGVSTNGPYQIPMECLMPKADQCDNLLAPVCVSSTHAAFGSIRMEPVFMILGQSAATIASMAIDKDNSVSKVTYEAVRERLLADDQILERSASAQTASRSSISTKDLPGITWDDQIAKRHGGWTWSRSTPGYVDQGYVHNGAVGTDASKITWSGSLKESGRYQLRVIYPAHTNRCPSTPIKIHIDEETFEFHVDQREADQWELSDSDVSVPMKMLGEFQIRSDNAIEIEVDGSANGSYVVVDAFNFLPITTGSK